jgi:hypothetical protein
VRYVGELKLPTLTSRTPLFAATDVAPLPSEEQATTAPTSTPQSVNAIARRTTPSIAVSDVNGAGIKSLSRMQ